MDEYRTYVKFILTSEVQLRPIEDFKGDFDAWSVHVEEYKRYAKLKQQIELHHMRHLEANQHHLTNIRGCRDLWGDDLKVDWVPI